MPGGPVIKAIKSMGIEYALSDLNVCLRVNDRLAVRIYLVSVFLIFVPRMAYRL